MELKKDIMFLLRQSQNVAYIVRYSETFRARLPILDQESLMTMIGLKAMHCFEWFLVSRCIAPGRGPAFQSRIPSNLIQYESIYFDRIVALLRILVAYGVDALGPNNRYFGWRFATPLAYNHVLHMVDHPFDADLAVSLWLEALCLAGLPTEQYLEQQHNLIHEEDWGSLRYQQRMSGRCRLRKFTTTTQDSPSNASEALEEFQWFGSELPWTPLPYVQNNSGHTKWLAYDANDKFNFPFRLRNLYLHLIPYSDLGRHPRKAYVNQQGFKDASKIRQKRFERREARKWRLAHPGQTPRTEKMPGSWVE